MQTIIILDIGTAFFGKHKTQIANYQKIIKEKFVRNMSTLLYSGKILIKKPNSYGNTYLSIFVYLIII